MLYRVIRRCDAVSYFIGRGAGGGGQVGMDGMFTYHVFSLHSHHTLDASIYVPILYEIERFIIDMHSRTCALTKVH